MITILCAGSRGDFQPYIALAQELTVAGKEVRIVGPSNFADFVEGYGVEYKPISVDMDTLDIDPKLLEDAGSSDNPLKMLLTFRKMKDYGVYTTHEYFEACQGSELVVYHPGLSIGYFAAEHLGIPSVLAAPFPLHRTKERLSVVMYGKAKPNRLNIAISHRMIQGMLWMAGGSSIKAFWTKRFGSVPRGFDAPFERHNTADRPALVSCSNYVFSRPTDWNQHIHQAGYWFVREPREFEPDPTLADFLKAGEKPVYVGFGSMSSVTRQGQIGDLVVEALKSSGKRGVISGFGQPENLGPDIFAVDSIPHTWLFQHVSAVVHHGGAGTTAAGFLAGVPSIVVPFSNDQFAWAHRAHHLGVGPKPIPRKHLTSGRLAAATAAADDVEIRTNAEALGRSIARENGARDCATVICRMLDGVDASETS